MTGELDYAFHAMGSDVRLLIGDPLLTSSPTPLEAADRERAFVWNFSDRLSRFRPDSDLSALNSDPRACVAAPALLRAAVNAGAGPQSAAAGSSTRPWVEPSSRAAMTTRSTGSSPPRSRRRSRTRRQDGLPSPVRLRCGDRLWSTIRRARSPGHLAS